MDTNDKISQLENEIKVLKNEVQAVLLDLRETYLNSENPFNVGPPPSARQQIIVTQAPVSEPQAEKPKSTRAGGENRDNGSELPAELPDNKDEAEVALEEPEEPVQTEPDFRLAAPPGTQKPGRKIDLISIAGLAHWVEESTRRFGKERTEAILEISEIIGYLPPDIKQILAKLINIEPDGRSGNITVKDYLNALIKFNMLLGKGSDTDAALLAILSQEDSHR